MLQQRKRSGFTLIELLVVIAIIAILIGLLVPAVQKVREAADNAKTRSNLSQVAVSAHTYGTDFNKLPPGLGTIGSGTTARTGTVLYFLLPYVEQKNLYDQDGVTPGTAKNAPVGIYTAPIDPTINDGKTSTGTGAASFAGNGLLFPIPNGTATSAAGLRYPGKAFGSAGSSNIVMFATVAGNCGPPGTASTTGHAHSDINTSWLPVFKPANGRKYDNTYIAQTPVALNPAGIQVALGDRSVRNVTQAVTDPTWLIVTNPQSVVPPGQDWNQD